MNSAIYHGLLRHRRFAPRPHAFSYSLFMVYLDLAELSSVFRGRWLWSTRRVALARFRREDYLGDPAVPLDQAVRDLVEQHGSPRPEGPIRLLTHLRYFGYGFNPVSFYYCFDRTGSTVQTIVAEVTNMPWRERHCYVLEGDGRPVPADRLHDASHKAMHVSPFMPMGLTYDWRFDTPDDTLNVHMALHGSDSSTVPAKRFDATLTLTRAPADARHLALALVRFPLMTAKVVAAIHWQALRLWLKRVPVFTHPAKAALTRPGEVPK